MPECIARVCTRDARNNLSIRLRRPDTSAIWAPNLDAYVCDVHSVSGARLHLFYEPTDTGAIESHVHGVASTDPARTTDIRQPAEALDEELAANIRRKVDQT